MGSPKSEWNSGFHASAVVAGKNVRYAGPVVKSNNEQHHSKKTNGFWIMETVVTFEMFEAFVIKTGYKFDGSIPEGFTDVNVQGKSWEQNKKYSWKTPGFYYFQQSKDSKYKIRPDQPVTTVS